MTAVGNVFRHVTTHARETAWWLDCSVEQLLFRRFSEHNDSQTHQNSSALRDLLVRSTQRRVKDHRRDGGVGVP